MQIDRLDSSSTWKSQEEIQNALASKPRRILVGLEWSDAYVCSAVLAFQYDDGDSWRLLSESMLTFTGQAGYYQMVDVTNALSTYGDASEATIFLHTEPFDSFVDVVPEVVLQAMIDDCYMVFNKRNFMKLLSHYECFKKPVAEYPIEIDADICSA